MIGQGRHGAPGAPQSIIGDGGISPICLEPELPVGKAKAGEEGGLLEWRLQAQPAISFKLRKVAVARFPQRPVNDLAWGHREGGMFRPDASSERGDHLMIRAAALGRLDDLGGELQMLMAPGGVNVIV